jgi:D-3-phosphoglycerate dehydrogenase
MIGAREFALLQRHALCIQLHASCMTTCRGIIHDRAALADALRQKAIAGAGLDAWVKEPPLPDHSPLQFNNVLVSPPMAGVSKAARANIGRIVAEERLDARDGKRPPRMVDPEACCARRFWRTLGYGPSEPFAAAAAG